MGYMNWDESLSVGVAEIDEQHKKLTEMINVFYDSIVEDKKNAFSNLLNSLIDYSVYHFTTEEKYMDKFNYPETETHKREHEKFKEKALAVKKRFDEGELIITPEITNFLREWISSHVLGTDKKYSKCFNDNGLQ